MHRITDNRISGQQLGNLQMLTSLCGQKSMPDVVIATTMWNEAQQESGNRREAELKSEVWKNLLNGCKIERFLDTYDSAWDIIGCHEINQVSANFLKRWSSIILG